MICPRCRVQLNRATTSQGVFFCCPRCNGRAVGIAVLRRVGSNECVQQLWRHSYQREGVPGAACPECQRKMIEVAVPLRQGPLRLDVCTGCAFIWFDPREFEQFPPAKVVQVPQLSDKAREARALAEIERINAESTADASGPDQPWEWIPGLLGLPVKENSPPLRHWPLATWGLSLALVVIYILTLAHHDAVIDDFGLIPSHPWRLLGLTFVTNFFLHATNPLHLIGNVYFLLVFGDNVEDDLGWLPYVALLALSAWFGDVLHVLGNLTGDAANLPSIGASGGISGVVAYYALRFPQARLGILWRYFVYFHWVHLPASAFLVIWFGMQLIIAFEQQAGMTNEAALAHLGGAAVGAAAWALWQLRNRQQQVANTNAAQAALGN